MEIRQTNDYSIFKFLKYNRTAGTNKKIAKSIETIDMTAYCPIIVTPDMSIIDGQNRFKICKDKGLPINYVVCDKDPEKAMLALNTATRNWAQTDWLHYYCSTGLPNYIRLRKLIDSTGVTISNAILLFSQNHTDSRKFKKGELVDESEWFLTTVDFIKRVIVAKDIRWQRPFVQAVMQFLIRHDGEKKVIRKLERKIISVPKLARIDDYLVTFENLVR
jgi:hypothetical protein